MKRSVPAVLPLPATRKKQDSRNAGSSFSWLWILLVMIVVMTGFVIIRLHLASLQAHSSLTANTKLSLPTGGMPIVSTVVKKTFEEISLPPAPPISPISSNLRGPTRKRRIAYAITITKDGSFQDGAAVLAYSIVKHSHGRDYDISLVAFVHPEVVKSRPVLTKLGFHVIEAPTPVNISAIKFTFLREKMNKNGCCGASELIKLNSYRLEQYDKVIHMDADVAMLNNIDEVINRNCSLIYTTDPNMATHKGEDHMPSQGGFLVIKPSLKDYRNIIDVVLTQEFMMGSGWNGSKIGWFWGGMTVQGVLPYYYNAANIRGQSELTPYGRRQIIDRCIYNTMADSDECQKTDISLIKTAHFTVCQKPWTCYQSHVNDLCARLHAAWFELRKEAERYYGLPVVENACINKFHKRGYMYMALDSAKLPDDSILVPDDSPGFLAPTEESRFLTADYEKFSGGKGNVPDTPAEIEEKRIKKEKRLAWEAKQKAKKGKAPLG